jgi:hypothetical protein
MHSYLPLSWTTFYKPIKIKLVIIIIYIFFFLKKKKEEASLQVVNFLYENICPLIYYTAFLSPSLIDYILLIQVSLGK